ncbi:MULTISPECIES: DUF4437 domain-containing protein [Mesorhizobium]|uniref:DUF4437 domain-containing protein n=2 Tax=Mesorhizobium TaxID=68287 RepID=A0A271KLS1_9HYPH|nr:MULTISPECIES: DUF4437 domain-containing protein [Mesorhizobium]PAP96791.1 hypothetical protein CIT31_03535 [Mesorhizobium wenxiniae]RWC47014.1 MAG: DUF4437 domain-containing protein [Mesorhizobium sp.]RWE98668.1 MAG: DUF4437 domain-containing protein [Mesorhizobium sp.]TIX84313.1 MAG: DUF4437 domain-containing protein [Mesorhizobium sp.]
MSVSFPKLVAAVAAVIILPSQTYALENTYLPVEKVPYYEEMPDQPHRLGPLWGKRDVGPAGTLLKVPGGWQAPIHAHTADYQGIVIEGTWSHWVPETGEGRNIELQPGSYWTQKADQMHADACMSEKQCVILLINTEPYSTLFKSR